MKTRLLYLLLLSSLYSFAQQYTTIPDANFENALINQGIDSGTPDQKVLTSSINTITTLDVVNKNIASLTGIQGFVALTTLYCASNQLTSLDVSQNVALIGLFCDVNQLTSLNPSKNAALINLFCGKNQLTSLDVSQNVALINLSCDLNKLTGLDVSKNITLINLSCKFNQLTNLNFFENVVLEGLDCSKNQLTSLDFSKNIALTYLNCSSNNLSSLNLKNGKNSQINNFSSSFTANPNLNCIQVDDVTYSNANWSTQKDATATYNSTCAALSSENPVFDKIAIYPIPTQNELHIDNVILEKAVVYDVLGKLVQTTTFANDSNNNTMSLAGMPKGMYYVYLHSAGAATVKNIMVE
jgi:Secretion system C-terminal sorting domain